MNNNCNYIIYQKHIHISIFFILLEIAGVFHIDIYLYCTYIIHIHTASVFLQFALVLDYFIRICKIICACDVLSSSTKVSSLPHKKMMVLQV